MGPEVISLIFTGVRLAEKGIRLINEAKGMTEDQAKARRLEIEAETDKLMERLRTH